MVRGKGGGGDSEEGREGEGIVKREGGGKDSGGRKGGGDSGEREGGNSDERRGEVHRGLMLSMCMHV